MVVQRAPKSRFELAVTAHACLSNECESLQYFSRSCTNPRNGARIAPTSPERIIHVVRKGSDRVIESMLVRRGQVQRREETIQKQTPNCGYLSAYVDEKTINSWRIATLNSGVDMTRYLRLFFGRKAAGYLSFLHDHRALVQQPSEN